jgi:hypothetical protein
MFFKSTLTVPKIKDLVNSPNQKYQNIYDTISHKSTSYTDIDLLPINDSSDTNMKNELKSFLKKQLNNDSDTNTNTVIGLDTMSGDKFSNF